MQAGGRLPHHATRLSIFCKQWPRSNSAHTNGRIDLALRAFNNNQFKSLQAAARSFDVPITIQGQRAADIQERRDCRPVNCKLSASVHEMATVLLSKHADASTLPRVGQHWVRTFINRSSELCSKYNCKYDYQRAKLEDPVHLRAYAGFSVCKIHLSNMKLRCEINITFLKSVSKWASFLLQRWSLHQTGLADHAQHSQEIANGVE